MTCKDCIHYDVCHLRINSIDFLPVIKGKVSMSSIMYKMCDDVEKRCEYFKDKSQIVKLPCKVGETLYCISYNDNFIKEYKNINLVNILTLMTALENPASRIVLLTGNKEEAEAKLKELNEND